MNDTTGQLEAAATQDQAEQRWRPLEAIERRVLGVLIEKAKTTPDAYPLTLNALTTGCNQKSNRSPQMQLEADGVADALERLRESGAVLEVQGSGRTAKYRHAMYEWLGVNGAELAVMAELLLRGPQTVGELRGRAARMAEIPDLAALHPIVQSLIDKRLVVALTPPGRGQMVTHGLYPQDELTKLRQREGDTYSSAPARAYPPPAPAVASPAEDFDAPLSDLRAQVEELRDDLAALRREVENLKARLPE